MNGGAWWATVHRVAKSWTLLSNFTYGKLKQSFSPSRYKHPKMGPIKKQSSQQLLKGDKITLGMTGPRTLPPILAGSRR